MNEMQIPSAENDPLNQRELLAQGTCAVLVSGRVVGTAWLASSDGFLLSAGHLFSGARSIQVRFTDENAVSANAVRFEYEPALGVDFAVLHTTKASRLRRPVPISMAREPTGAFELCGYGSTLQDQSGGIGEFLPPLDVDNSAANRMFALRSSELADGGYSGGAVFSKGIGAAVAIQVEATTKSAGAHRDTILAMPLYRVANFWEDLDAFAAKETVSERIERLRKALRSAQDGAGRRTIFLQALSQIQLDRAIPANSRVHAEIRDFFLDPNGRVAIIGQAEAFLAESGSTEKALPVAYCNCFTTVPTDFAWQMLIEAGKVGPPALAAICAAIALKYPGAEEATRMFCYLWSKYSAWTDYFQKHSP